MIILHFLLCPQISHILFLSLSWWVHLILQWERESGEKLPHLSNGKYVNLPACVATYRNFSPVTVENFLTLLWALTLYLDPISSHLYETNAPFFIKFSPSSLSSLVFPHVSILPHSKTSQNVVCVCCLFGGFLCFSQPNFIWVSCHHCTEMINDCDFDLPTCSPTAVSQR